MVLPSKILGQKTFNTRPKIEKDMLVVMNNSNHETNLSQPLQTKIIQFKIAVIFLTGDIGIFSIKSKNVKFYSTVSVNDDDFKKTFPPRAHQIESLNIGIKRNDFEEGFFTEAIYPSTIKPIFSNPRVFYRTFMQFQWQSFCFHSW